jgi:hypothetical protein
MGEMMMKKKKILNKELIRRNLRINKRNLEG